MVRWERAHPGVCWRMLARAPWNACPATRCAVSSQHAQQGFSPLPSIVSRTIALV